jgi:hypothetical protein
MGQPPPGLGYEWSVFRIPSGSSTGFTGWKKETQWGRKGETKKRKEEMKGREKREKLRERNEASSSKQTSVTA